MDYFAIATQGYYSTPTPDADERMAFAASWGYVSVGGEPEIITVVLRWGVDRWNSVKWNLKRWGIGD